MLMQHKFFIEKEFSLLFFGKCSERRERRRRRKRRDENIPFPLPLLSLSLFLSTIIFNNLMVERHLSVCLFNNSFIPGHHHSHDLCFSLSLASLASLARFIAIVNFILVQHK
jgi:hypothetical protein